MATCGGNEEDFGGEPVGNGEYYESISSITKENQGACC